MKYGFKKTVAAALTVTMAMTATVPAFAETMEAFNNVPSVSLSQNVFAENYSETVEIDGIIIPMIKREMKQQQSQMMRMIEPVLFIVIGKPEKFS